MNRERFTTELETLLEVSPGELREEDQIRSLEHWDSLTLLGLLALADAQFNIQLNPDRLAGCVTIGDILNLLEESSSLKGAQQ